METKMRKSSMKLHTHTHICYNIVAEISFHAKITKNGNEKLNQDIEKLAKEVILS